MKALDLRQKKKEELLEMAEALRAKIESVRFGARGKSVKNVKEAGTARKDIARIMTVLREIK